MLKVLIQLFAENTCKNTLQSLLSTVVGVYSRNCVSKMTVIAEQKCIDYMEK